MTEVLNRPDTEAPTRTVLGPPEMAHIVMTPAGEVDETPQAYVMRARVEGFEVVALCGYVFVPSKNPRELPPCDECVAIYWQPGEHRDERDEMPDA